MEETIKETIKVNINGLDSECDIFIFPINEKRICIIAKERVDNPGRSITNGCETFAEHVLMKHSIDPDNFLWIEHYGKDTGVDNKENYDIVSFTSRVTSKNVFELTHPEWHALSKERLEELIKNKKITLEKHEKNKKEKKF